MSFDHPFGFLEKKLLNAAMLSFSITLSSSKRETNAPPAGLLSKTRAVVYGLLD